MKDYIEHFLKRRWKCFVQKKMQMPGLTVSFCIKIGTVFRKSLLHTSQVTIATYISSHHKHKIHHCSIVILFPYYLVALKKLYISYGMYKVHFLRSWDITLSCFYQIKAGVNTLDQNGGYTSYTIYRGGVFVRNLLNYTWIRFSNLIVTNVRSVKD